MKRIQTCLYHKLEKFIVNYVIIKLLTMKIVNLISGQKRVITENIESFKNLQTIDNENNYNFFVFWDNNNLSEEENNLLKKNFKNFFYKKISISLFKKKFKKEFSEINNNKLFKNSEKEIFKSWLYQYYILYEAFKYAKKMLGKKSENYLWQRIRSDLYVPSKIYIEKIVKNSKYLFFSGAKLGQGLNDYYCVGTYKNFKNFCSTIDLLRFLLVNSVYIPPEVVINTQLTRTKSYFTIDRSLPTYLIRKEKNKIILRNICSGEKSSRYLSANYSNYISNQSKINESDKLVNSLMLKFFYSFVDFYQHSKFFLRNLF